MAIEQFTKEQFEAALPVSQQRFNKGERLWYYNGFDGEHSYRVQIIDSRYPELAEVEIEVRSTVGKNGLSADLGKDSIRVWLVLPNGSPLGSKASRWLTRVAGWEKRLTDNLRILWNWRVKAGDCLACAEPKAIFRSKSLANPKRMYAKCMEHEGFAWLEKKK